MGKRWLSHVTGVFVLVESTERSAGLRAGVDEEPKVKLLMTIPNVSVIVAAVFVSVSDEAGRFRNAHQVGAYLGLVPSEKSSGDRRRLGAITKQATATHAPC